jgi:hypothetical protein
MHFQSYLTGKCFKKETPHQDIGLRIQHSNQDTFTQHSHWEPAPERHQADMLTLDCYQEMQRSERSALMDSQTPELLINNQFATPESRTAFLFQQSSHAAMAVLASQLHVMM